MFKKQGNILIWSIFEKKDRKVIDRGRIKKRNRKEIKGKSDRERRGEGKILKKIQIQLFAKTLQREKKRENRVGKIKCDHLCKV